MSFWHVIETVTCQWALMSVRLVDWIVPERKKYIPSLSTNSSLFFYSKSLITALSAASVARRAPTTPTWTSTSSSRITRSWRSTWRPYRRPTPRSCKPLVCLCLKPILYSLYILTCIYIGYGLNSYQPAQLNISLFLTIPPEINWFAYQARK